MNDKYCESGDSAQMSPKTMMRRSIVGTTISLPVIALIIVVLFVTTGGTRMSQVGVSLIASFVFTVCIGIPCAITLTWIGFRWGSQLGRWLIPVHALVLIVIATTGSLAASFVLQFIRIIRPHEWWSQFLGTLPFAIVITLLVGLSMSTYTMLRYQLQTATLELHKRQMEQERSAKLLSEARLSSLESRIHPHFLFNTLNSIAALIPRDPQRAEDTVGRLASLLRFSLNTPGSGLAPLAQEMKIVRDYLEIENTRFGSRLRYEIDMPESLATVKAPPLAVQTLVENAVKHVVAHRPEGANIRISAHRRGNAVHIEVVDDGPGFTLDAITPEHGLGNLVARLDFLFGESGRLGVTRRDNWTVVSLTFPTEQS